MTLFTTTKLLFGVFLVLNVANIDERNEVFAISPEPTTTTSTPFSTKMTQSTTQETSPDSNISGKKQAVFAVVTAVLCLVVIFLICYILIRRRAPRLVSSCKAEKEKSRSKDEDATEVTDTDIDIDDVNGSSLTNPGENRPGLERNASIGEDIHVLSQTQENVIDSTIEGQNEPVYEVLEATYATPHGILNSQDNTINLQEDVGGSSIQATVGGVRNTGNKDTTSSFTSEICETSFLEEIYTSLNADRGENTNSIYASLCKPDGQRETERERDILATLPGIESSDQDYVFL